MRKFFTIVLVVALNIMYMGICIAQTDENGPEVGADAPDFTLVGLDGNSVTLSDVAGTEPIVLIFGSCT